MPKVKGKDRLPALSIKEQVVLIRSLKAVLHSRQNSACRDLEEWTGLPNLEMCEQEQMVWGQVLEAGI